MAACKVSLCSSEYAGAGPNLDHVTHLHTDPLRNVQSEHHTPPLFRLLLYFQVNNREQLTPVSCRKIALCRLYERIALFDHVRKLAELVCQAGKGDGYVRRRKASGHIISACEMHSLFSQNAGVKQFPRACD